MKGSKHDSQNQLRLPMSDVIKKWNLPIVLLLSMFIVFYLHMITASLLNVFVLNTNSRASEITKVEVKNTCFHFGF